ncbi:hypothetical protein METBISCDRAFT_15165 [Metschnikowia bicuspidata]|uniref:PIH1 N-terminal domain-containing protein n=1 Tax=Metschnikowia bicuspidata TaxID=27322 RepID=A0A4P9ZDT1_9ASCO|nr:hypothetical protein METBISCDRAFT_15165 [Metschnikowia bicuspidata]
MGAIFESKLAIRLTPTPEFVVKTSIVTGSGDHAFGRKVFINVCHDPQVPKPPGPFEIEAVFAQIVKNEWEIPIVVSPEKVCADKKGALAFVYDCCINSECFAWTQLYRDLRLILIEWAIEAVETMHELVLKREYSVPKMLSKGELSQTELTADDVDGTLQRRMAELQQNETAALVELLMPEEDDSGDLPDLMNIGQTRRPLIEEIGELSIQEGRGSRENNSRTSINSEGAVIDDNGQAGSGSIRINVVEYTFLLSSKLQGKHFHLVFRSPQLTHLITVYSEPGEVRFRNLDPTRRLGPQNTLAVPIPPAVTLYKGFVVEKEKSLYVFGRTSNGSGKTDRNQGSDLNDKNG